MVQIETLTLLPDGNATWYVSSEVCALADSERHLGHAVRQGDAWLAFDARHVNRAHDGLSCLGQFPNVIAAKRAIESIVGVSSAAWKLDSNLRELASI
jgi:hypothetical protein